MFAKRIRVLTIPEEACRDCEVRSTEGEERAQLAFAERKVGGLDHRTDARQRDLKEAELHPVGKLHGDDVTAGHPGSEEPGREGVGRVLQLRKGELAFGGYDGHIVGVCRNRLVEEVVESAVRPEARVDPPLAVRVAEVREVVRAGGHACHLLLPHTIGHFVEIRPGSWR